MDDYTKSEKTQIIRRLEKLTAIVKAKAEKHTEEEEARLAEVLINKLKKKWQS